MFFVAKVKIILLHTYKSDWIERTVKTALKRLHQLGLVCVIKSSCGSWQQSLQWGGGGQVNGLVNKMFVFGLGDQTD